jgi:hypothetical protein
MTLILSVVYDQFEGGNQTYCCRLSSVGSSWNVMAYGVAREGKWRGNWRMEWVSSTLHTTSEHGVSSITTADAHTSALSSRLNWRPRRFKCSRPFRRKTKSSFCACAITFQTQISQKDWEWQRKASDGGVEDVGFGACAYHPWIVMAARIFCFTQKERNSFSSSS